MRVKCAFTARHATAVRVERLLFQLLGFAFVLLTVTLVSGRVFLRRFVRQGFPGQLQDVFAVLVVG